jgi:hypothetical protein
MDNESVKEVLEQFYEYMHAKEWFDDPGAASVFNAFTDLIVSQNNRIVELENKVKQLEQSQNPKGSMTLQGYIDELPG